MKIGRLSGVLGLVCVAAVVGCEQAPEVAVSRGRDRAGKHEVPDYGKPG
ncbi:MAG UNVERIFIED_CONTAM: hypothetical protein LVR18_19505 [Planctomycetaceae bacterium]